MTDLSILRGKVGFAWRSLGTLCSGTPGSEETPPYLYMVARQPPGLGVTTEGRRLWGGSKNTWNLSGSERCPWNLEENKRQQSRNVHNSRTTSLECLVNIEDWNATTRVWSWCDNNTHAILPHYVYAIALARRHSLYHYTTPWSATWSWWQRRKGTYVKRRFISVG